MDVYDLVPDYFTLIDHDPVTLPNYLLGPFLATTTRFLRPLERYGRIDSPRYPHPRSNPDGQWRRYDNADLEHDLLMWYGLSRVNDFLLLPFQSNTLTEPFVSSHWQQAYRQFFEALGFTLFDNRPYSPFYHEIIEVVASVGQEEPKIERVFWPGLMFGAMLFSRAGVRVGFPDGVVQQHIAEESPLYFTYQRQRRKTYDLSLGWGHNSQWRTRFHRSYEGAEHLYFNVDGDIDLSSSATFTQWLDEWHDWLHQTEGARARTYPGGYDGPNAGLPYAARRELLLNRCFVQFSSPSNEEWWPYFDTLTAPKGAALWRL